MAPHSVFAETAPLYWGAGLPVIPLVGKAAFVHGWPQYALNLPSHEEREAWIAMHGAGNIGLVLGPTAGVTVVDVDTDDPELQASGRGPVAADAAGVGIWRPQVGTPAPPGRPQP